MRTSRIPVALVLACCLALAGDLTEKRREELKAVRPLLAGPLRAEEAEGIRKALSSFTIPELREIEDHAEFRDLTEDEQGYLRHAVSAIVFVAGHERDLREPCTIALLLGSPMWNDWLEGIRRLEKEEFGAGLERVAVALSSDPRLPGVPSPDPLEVRLEVRPERRLVQLHRAEGRLDDREGLRRVLGPELQGALRLCIGRVVEACVQVELCTHRGDEVGVAVADALLHLRDPLEQAGDPPSRP